MYKSAVTHGDSSVVACYIMVKHCHSKTSHISHYLTGQGNVLLRRGVWSVRMVVGKDNDISAAVKNGFCKLTKIHRRESCTAGRNIRDALYMKARIDTNDLELLLLFISETAFYKIQRCGYIANVYPAVCDC